VTEPVTAEEEPDEGEYTDEDFMEDDFEEGVAEEQEDELVDEPDPRQPERRATTVAAPEPVAPDAKSKRARFKELVIPRLTRALGGLRVVANCGNRGNYEYTENEARQIVEQLRAAVDQVEASFTEKAHKDQVSIEFED
jgi:hypothetical protein